MDKQDFYAGREFFAHDFLGAHLSDTGMVWRTFAPSAEGIVVIGDSGEWPMHKIYDGNFWEAEAEGIGYGEHYVYRIYHGGSYQDHCDPYGFAMELRPDWRSISCDLSYQWHDQKWMAARKKNDSAASYTAPINMYEMHLGSWRKRSGERISDDPADWYSFSELAEILPAYLKENAYNYVEFMPLAEHPFDGSWGYQTTGFFAATSRYGSPTQLMQLVDALHTAGIGVILDFVPVHFATDAYGLANYDGTALFEYPHAAVGVSEWGSHNFMHSRGETCSFLQSAANFWLTTYHFDGLRLDAVSRIIYWQGDESRGVNANAVEFVRRFTSGMHSLNPGALMIAEDSTDFDGTTRPVEEGGLGFDYKWDMGWMHDTLELFQTGQQWRPENYHKLSFSMMYFHRERYLMPLSHDEVVHGKATILQKMDGDYEKKFPQARTLYLYMIAHPGKQLNFMGSEFGQLREWDEKREQDWMLLEYPVHQAFARYCRELNHCYLTHPALWDQDYVQAGFQWRQVEDAQHMVYAFERHERGMDGERILCVLNLSDQPWPAYQLQLDATTKLTPLINSDWDIYGGSCPRDAKLSYVVKEGSVTLDLAPLSAVLLRLD
ncbi:1,4-alpha-glucan branching protein GlgB [Olegusella massiliensis]|uniref:1,4-alpha-glucan branching protein GlgB n=1 Tax=Olegusella massiliensis TaxID=1776381 RepID=UPI0040554ED1